jgi:hypothetical protein
MPKSRDEMLRVLEKLIDEYLAFQRSRPDLPRGNLWALTGPPAPPPRTTVLEGLWVRYPRARKYTVRLAHSVAGEVLHTGDDENGITGGVSSSYGDAS